MRKNDIFIFTIFIALLSFSVNAQESLVDKSPEWWGKATPQKVNNLIIKGANINESNEKGMTPLYFAAINSSYDVVKFLLENGVNINKGKSPLHTIAVVTGKERRKITELLIDNGMNINDQDEYGNTPLMNSIILFPNLDYIKMLINKGADVNKKNNENQTALMCAMSHALAIQNSEISQDIPEIINYLTEIGSDKNAKDRFGRNILHYLFSGAPCSSFLYDGQKELRMLILKSGAEINSEILIGLSSDKDTINSQDINGVTPLMLAALTDNSKGNIELLINRGADVNIEDNKGATVLDYAKVNPYMSQKTYSLLKNNMNKIVNLDVLHCVIEKNKEICEDRNLEPFTGTAIFESYYGEMLAKISYKNGLLDGEVKAYDAIDKYMYLEANYKNGELLNSKCYDKYGNVIQCKCNLFNWKIKQIINQCR